MGYDPKLHHRRSIRLKDFDYSTPGGYFITFNVHQRVCLLGEIKASMMHTSAFGEAVRAVWENLPKHYPNLELDAFVVMPNHIHAIFILNENTTVGPGLRPGLKGGNTNNDIGENLEAAHLNGDDGGGRPGLRPGPINGGTNKPVVRKPVTVMVGSLKSFSARRINQLRSMKGVPVWQEDYFETIIRNEEQLQAIREYIIHNPLNWETDSENPSRKV